MKRHVLAIVTLVAASGWSHHTAHAAPLETKFTFQGQLKQGGAIPPDGSVNMVFRLFNEEMLGTALDTDPPAGSHSVPVTDGLFTQDLTFDNSHYNGQRLWLEIEVEGNTLSPRQELRATPYALQTRGIFVSSSGLVGIGTSSPSDRLHVVGSTLLEGTGIHGLYLNGNDTGNVEIAINNGAGNHFIFDDDSDGHALKIESATNRDLAFGTSGPNERMRITSTGEVGIGTSNPSSNSTLHIQGPSPGGAATGQIRIDGSETSGAADTGGGIWFSGHDGTGATTLATVQGLKENGTVGNNASYLRFGTSPDGANVSERMRISSSGDVGIGTASPKAALQIDTNTFFDLSSTPSGQDNLLLTDNFAGGQGNVFGSIGFGNNENSRRAAIAAMQTGTDPDHQGLAFYTHQSSVATDDLVESIRIKHDGAVGIGTTDPQNKLHVNGIIRADNDIDIYNNGIRTIRLQPDEGGVGEGGTIKVSNGNGDVTAELEGDVTDAGRLLLYDSAGSAGPATIVLRGDTGRVTARVVEITGADLAEKFPVSEKAEAGTVMEIDPEHPGQLRVSRGAHNRRVAGVVSGANGLSVGVVLGNLPGHEDAPPIAMSGRVWTLCDTANGSIKVGDLLTTSDVSGHAMTVTDHGAAQGATIGKAMTALESGRGLVLVLVSLQ